jgi:nucleoside-diphosphate-sugar epimerase
MTVLVTGGTGFVGSHAAARLVRAGRPVRLLVRDPAKVARAPALVGVDVEVVVGDVTDRESVARAIDGCDAVVHAAAQVSLASREAARTEAINVGGTRTVLGEAAARSLPSVTVSSTTVFRIDCGIITTETPLITARGSYTRSKVAAERVAREFHAAGAPVAIVYPSGVLGPDGPDVTVNHEALVVWLRTPPRTTSGTGVVDVRDVATAIERGLTRPGRWMLGGSFLTWPEMHETLTRITGVRRRAVPMPGPLLRFAGSVGDITKRVVPFDFPLTREAMALATRAVPFDSTHTCSALDLHWRPVEETLGDSIRWLASIGHLDARLAGALAP